MIDLDTKNIEELINLLKENDLTELEYEKDDEHIRIKRANSESFAQPVSVSPPVSYTHLTLPTILLV